MPARGTRPREPIQRGSIPKGPALWRPRPESGKVKGAKGVFRETISARAVRRVMIFRRPNSEIIPAPIDARCVETDRLD